MASTRWDIATLSEQVMEHLRVRPSSSTLNAVAVFQTLETVASALEGRYLAPQLAGVGGTGIVLRVDDSQLGSQRSAVKISTPEVNAESRLSTSIRSEVSKLSQLRHGSLIRLQGYQTLRTSDRVEVSYLISEWVDGEDSQSFFLRNEVDEPQLVTYIKQVVAGISHLHKSGVAHLDLKPTNILIGLDGHAYIADLGSAKFVSTLDDDTTLLAATPRWADRELMRLISDGSTQLSVQYGVPRRAIRLQWDFAPLGRIFLSWLGLDPFSRTVEPIGGALVISNYVRKYLLLMAARLLGVDNVPEWLLEQVGISVRLLHEVQYREASDVELDIAKLTGEYALETRIPELSAFPSSVIQVTADTPAPFTRRVKQLVENRALGRLAGVTQLGVISQIYPTANHTRLEHSLGTFRNTCQIVRSLWLDPGSPLFRQMVSEFDITALLAASLLHDAGQFPLAHDLEEIAPKIFDHERITRKILARASDSSDLLSDRSIDSLSLLSFDDVVNRPADSLREILQAWNTTPERVIELLLAKPALDRAPIRDRILHSLVDGPLDADKLDYLVRDSSRLGIPYGNAIDVDRIIRNLTVVVDESRVGRSIATVGVHEKGRVAAEFVTIARSAMFAQAYWHHTVRAIKAMLARAVDSLIITRGLEDPSRRRSFITAFEDFVLGLDQGHRGPQGSPAEPSTLNPNDSAVLRYIHHLLADRAERKLLVDILERKYYRRLVIFSLDHPEYAEVADAWDRLKSSQKLTAVRLLESDILQELDARLSVGPTTEFLNGDSVSVLRARVLVGDPVILVDVPVRRSGSDVPLYFAREASVRELRRHPRALNEVDRSDAWTQYGAGMRERVGKLRVFAHPDCVDAMEHIADRDRMIRLLRSCMKRAA